MNGPVAGTGASAIARRTLIVLAAGIAALVFGGGVARAGSGDFCYWSALSPGQACYGEYHAYLYEVESWNSDGKGVASCAGVYNGAVRGSNCVRDGSGYDEVYCSASCADQAGEPFSGDHSAYSSVFTGWADWQ